MESQTFGFVFIDFVGALQLQVWHNYARAVKGSPLGGVVYAYTPADTLRKFMQDMSSITLILTRSANKEGVGSLGVSTFSHGLAPALPTY